MKILAIGDFHGEWPKKFEKIIKNKKIDVLVSNGDYLPFAYRKLWFKHCFEKTTQLWEAIGKERYKKLISHEMKMGENVLRKMEKLSVPSITVLGNVDYPDPDGVASN